ncbi:MAG: hypothetical protein AAGH90_09395 [Pseudomonadota bacterium]
MRKHNAMTDGGSKNDVARLILQAVLIDGGVVLIGVVLFLFFDDPLWLIGGIVLGAILSLPPLLKIFRRSRS